MGHMTIAAKPSMLIDLGYAYSSGAVISTPIGLIASANSPDVKPVLPFRLRLESCRRIGFSGSAPNIGAGGIYNDHNVNHNGFGNLTYIRGQHSFKFGISYDHYQKLENALKSNQGSFSFTNSGVTPTSSQASGLSASTPSLFDAEWASFLIGNANGGFTQASIAPTANVNQNDIELYAQDDWRATRRLTVNLGVRYSYFGQPYDINNELSNFSPTTFDPLHAETISSNGNLCTVAGQTVASAPTSTPTGVTITYTLNNCPNVNGLNAYQPNTVADPLDGIILADPDLIKQVNSRGLYVVSVRRSVGRTVDRYATVLLTARKWAMRRSMTLLPASGLPTMCSAMARPLCAAATEWRMTTRR